MSQFKDAAQTFAQDLFENKTLTNNDRRDIVVDLLERMSEHYDASRANIVGAMIGEKYVPLAKEIKKKRK